MRRLVLLCLPLVLALSACVADTIGLEGLQVSGDGGPRDFGVVDLGFFDGGISDLGRPDFGGRPDRGARDVDSPDFGAPDADIPELCGDGVITGSESCDDANHRNGDGCNNTCKVELGWACSGAPSVCVGICGDGFVVRGEECDDGNSISGDGCEPNCLLTSETCGNGMIEPGEDCDDGNVVPGDGCGPSCMNEDCGNNVVDPGEDCDDGNEVGGDGCSPECLVDVIASTNIVSAGFGGMRDIGTGVIELEGVTGTVSRALLYWAGPADVVDPLVNSAVTFANTPVFGTNIGVSGDSCWGLSFSHAYRADVTSLVAGDGTYALADFVKTEANIHGVSLVVFFDDGDAANNRDVYLYESNDANIDNPFDGVGWSQTYGGMLYSGTGDVTLELHVADGQAFNDEAVDLNGMPFIPQGMNWSGMTVPNGPSASGTGGGLWDITQHPVTPFFVTGSNTLMLTASGPNSDCLSLIAAIFILPAP